VVLGKGGKTRTVPLNEEARRILAKPRVGPHVFDVPGRNSPSILRRITATISKAAGVSFHVHLLRHSFSSRLLAAGVDVVTISNLLGHSAAMTALIYAHSNPRLEREAVTKLVTGIKTFPRARRK
jgi:integrase